MGNIIQTATGPSAYYFLLFLLRRIDQIEEERGGEEEAPIHVLRRGPHQGGFAKENIIEATVCNKKKWRQCLARLLVGRIGDNNRRLPNIARLGEFIWG